MVEKKVKKVKKSDGEPQAPRPTKVVEMEDIKQEAKPKPEEYDALKKRYSELKKRYDELEKAFGRISTLEEDIKKVHRKLDTMDTNSANVKKDLDAVKNRVASVSKDMRAITVVARNISQKYGFDIKVDNTQQTPQRTQQPQRSAAPPKQPAPAQGQQRPSPVFTRAAKALAFARGAERSKQGSDEITAQPLKGKGLEPRDHKDASDRMDDVTVTGDDDMDTVDYLVRPDGKKVPLEKKKVVEELKELKDED